jgi:hypothetical protein
MRPLFVLALIVPYHQALWWAFSYEARFLLTLLPFYAVLAGRLVDVTWRWIAPHITAAGRRSGPAWVSRAVPVALATACVGIALIGVWPRLGAVYHLVREPLASEHDVRLRLRPDQTQTVDYLRASLSPGADSILLLDGSYEYFLTDYKTAVFYPVTLAEAREWDYLVLPGWAPGLYKSLGHDHSEFWLATGDPAEFQEIYRAPVDGGSIVYKVLR